MNFIDKLNILVGNERKTTTAAGNPCWNGQGTPVFPGKVVSRSESTTEEGNFITYGFPLDDPCITSIVNVTKTKMCASQERMPCCSRRNPARTKCVEIKTMFIVPYEGSGLSPLELDPNHLQIPAGSPILVKGTINIYPSGYEFTTKEAKPHLADMDALPIINQTAYINREN